MSVNPLPTLFLGRITLAEFQSGDQAAHARVKDATDGFVNIACVFRPGVDGVPLYEVWGDAPAGKIAFKFEDSTTWRLSPEIP